MKKIIIKSESPRKLDKENLTKYKTKETVKIMFHVQE